MRLSNRRTWRLLALLLAFTLTAAACGGDDDDAGGDVPSDVTGTVNISGSSTVEPISSLVADLLAEENDGIDVTVDGPGTGDGFKLFCEGSTDISDASRPIKAEEAKVCADAGIEFVELKVAFDGITVMTHPDNDAIECLSFADLYALIGPEATADNWSDASALASSLGSKTDFPDEDLEIFGPGEESGTYDSFIEIALAGIAATRKADTGSTRKSYQPSANDNVIIEGVTGSEYSLGWVGFAFAEEAGDDVREIAISKTPGGTCVEPSVETIADGTYPISRALYIYVNIDKAASNEALAAYVDFYLSDDGIAAVSEAGYVELPDDELDATRDRWEARTPGPAA
ncbi:MAG: phosphate ABC transporter substrate-binding protein PstS family protein [Acidimicrobiia bacterium]